MIVLLTIVLLMLMILVGGDRGAKSFIALACNVLLLVMAVFIISHGVNPVLVTIIGTIIFCQITLIYQNGHNLKTYAAVISVVGVILLLSLLVSILATNININMNQLMICMIIISLLGAVMDTAMAITSSLYEFNEVNSELTFSELVRLGFNVGRDILGTTVNTIFFATIGETMMIGILFIKNKYTFESVINSKEFYKNLFDLVISNIGCLLIIPISIFICTYMIKSNNSFIKKVKDYCQKMSNEN